MCGSEVGKHGSNLLNFTVETASFMGGSTGYDIYADDYLLASDEYYIESRDRKWVPEDYNMEPPTAEAYRG